MSPQALAGFVKDFHKSSLGFRGHLITNFPRCHGIIYNKWRTQQALRQTFLKNILMVSQREPVPLCRSILNPGIH